MFARRTPAILVCSLLLAACGDDGAAPPQTDTTEGADTAAVDDTMAVEDGVSPTDTTTPDDTVSVTDTASVADTVPAADTTSVADTATGPGFETTCPGILQCIAVCAGLPVTQQQSCAQACINAAVADEKDAFLDFYTCLSTKNCLTDDTSDEALRFAFECQRQCLPQEALCFAGTFGDGGCAVISGCVANCDEEDYACQRACFAAGSEANVQYFLDYQYCGLSQCYDSTDPLAQESCLTQVAAEPVCSDPYNQCFGTTGAGPGPGAGGGR